MKQIWLKLAKNIDAKTPRERSMLFLVATVGVFLLANSFIIEPMWKKHKSMVTRNLDDQNQINVVQLEIAQRSINNTIDPDAEIKARISAAQKRLQIVDAELKQLSKNLVPAEDVGELLETILRKNKSLYLSSFKSLPVVNLMPSANAVSRDNGVKAAETGITLLNTIEERGIYKHEVELVLQGNYLDMLHYMHELEGLPQHVFWSSSTFSTVEYPKARLHLNLYTLSLENKWLNL